MCGCNGAQPQDAQYEVHLPNGEVRIVNSEPEAKAAISGAGGGTYSRR